MKKVRERISLAILAAAFWPTFAQGNAYFDQQHYRWRNDDGDETTATWKADADTPVVDVTRQDKLRLRFAVANTSTSHGGG